MEGGQVAMSSAYDERPTPPAAPSPSSVIRGRVSGAENRLKELASRIDALFTALDAPGPTPPWRLEAPSSGSPSAAPASSAELAAARSRAEEAEATAEELRARLEDTEQRMKLASLEVDSVRGALDRLRTTHEQSLSALELTRAELERARSESGPIDLGHPGIDPELFQQLEDELELVKKELEETRQAHAKALEQIADGLPEPTKSEDSVVRAMRAEDALQQMQEHIQRQLLEHEETRRQRDELRRANEQLRAELRLAQQKRDHYKAQLQAGGDVNEMVQQLRRAVGARDKSIEELGTELRAKQREIETHEKREAHLREALNRKNRR